MPEPSLYDKLLELASPFPKQAEAAPWSEVLKLMRRAEPLLKADKKGLAALERLTEEYPSVRGTSLTTGPHPSGSHYTIEGGWSDVPWFTDFAKKGHPYNKIHLQLDQPVVKTFGLPSTYAHEASHAFSGGSAEMGRWLSSMHPELFPWKQELFKRMSPAVEGFAEGSGNALLNQFNKKADQWYWSNRYRNNPEYVNAGWLGRDVGEAIRRGEKVPQLTIIEQLMDLIKQYAH